MVDVANDDGVNVNSISATNGNSSPRENGNSNEKTMNKKDYPSHSPHSSISSNSSTPSSKHKEVCKSSDLIISVQLFLFFCFCLV